MSYRFSKQVLKIVKDIVKIFSDLSNSFKRLKREIPIDSLHRVDYISELPDCILSDILSMLSIKDLLRTSILSKRWSHLWALRRDLNFDVHNVLGNEKELLLAGYLEHVLQNTTVVRYLHLSMCADEFIKRVDQFVKKYQGSKIDSFVLNFHLDSKHSNFIDRWISFAIAMGVEKICLLFFGRPYAHYSTSCKPYKFPFGLFSKFKASTLKHMCLQRCLVCHPTDFDFIPFTSLRSFQLERVKVDEIFITGLLSNCLLLEEMSLISCEFKSSMPKILSSSLCHLKVSGCFVRSNDMGMKDVNLSSLDCLKLTSLVYRGSLDALSINTPVLKIINYSVFLSDIPNALSFFATLPQLEILHLRIYLEITTSPKITQPLKHLKELNFIINLFQEESDLLWIFAVLQASPLLQKLSVMVIGPKFFDNQKDMKDIEMFPHDELKVIEMGGCVGNWYEIEFAMNVLNCAHKLERIVMSPYWRHHGTTDWNFDPVWFQNGRERISKKLQGRAELEIWLLGLLQKAFYIRKLEVHLKDQFLSSMKAPEHILQADFFKILRLSSLKLHPGSLILGILLPLQPEFLELVEYPSKS